MDVFGYEKHDVDMTKSGRYCFGDGYQLEKVTGEERYTCHMCGATYTYEKYDKTTGDGQTGSIGIWFQGIDNVHL